jgi:hypothetical protein
LAAEPVPSSGNESSPGFSDEEEDGKRKGGNKDLRQSEPDLVLTCYVLMLDIAYKQVTQINDDVKDVKGISHLFIL